MEDTAMTMATPKEKELTIDDLDELTHDELHEMIQKAIHETRPNFAQHLQSKDAYNATEQHLSAYPTIKKKIDLDYRRLDKHLLQCGNCQSDDENSESVIAEIRARIITNEHEVWEIDNAIEFIADDEYAKIIPCLFFEGKSIRETCNITSCSRSTIFRQKKDCYSVWRYYCMESMT
jgi:hypothetical protein